MFLMRRRGFVVEVFDSPPFERGMEHSFYGADHCRILCGYEGECVAASGGAACPAYAVDVCLGCIGNIEVYDVRNLRDVYAARCNVCCNQYLKCAVAKPVQCRLPPVLRKVPLKRCRFVTGLAELFSETLGAVFGAGEDQHRFSVRMMQQLKEQAGFEML